MVIATDQVHPFDDSEERSSVHDDRGVDMFVSK
jgi:hypothetical protein